MSKRKNIGIVIYANPDYLPPVISAIFTLAKEFNLFILCRNQDDSYFIYPPNVRIYRLGCLKKAKEKENQSCIGKILEYLIFTMRSIFYLKFHHCQLIYSYDMHGFLSGFIANCLGRGTRHIYHNLDIREWNTISNLTFFLKKFELAFSRWADKIVFPDIYRARTFQKEAKLRFLPEVIMNAPLRVDGLPARNRLREILSAKGIGINRRVILVQGVLSEAICIPEVIKSMPYWPDDAILVLLGNGEEDFLKKVFSTIRLLGLENKYLHIPRVPYSELFSYTIGAYLGLAIYKPVDINMKYSGGGSNKLFEYLSLGIPPLLSNTPYFYEVIDESMAYFANPYSPEDIGTVINSALSDRETYLKKSHAARKAHLDKLNYEEQSRLVVDYMRKSI